MKKSLLIQLPIQPQKLVKTQSMFALYAYMVHIDEDVLVVDGYYSHNDQPIFRIFISSSKHCSLKRFPEQCWTECCIDYLIDGYRYNCYSSRDKVYEGDEYTSEIVAKALTSWGLGSKEGNAYDLILAYQRKLADIKLQIKYKKITDPIDQRMNQVPELPDDFDVWIDEEALYHSRYIFYNYTTKKIKQGYCSHCNAEVMVDNPKHNMEGTCPSCGSKVMYKAFKKQKYITDHNYAYVINRIENELVVRTFSVQTIYRRIDTTGIFHKETHRHEFNRRFYSIQGKELDGYAMEMFKQREYRWCESEDLTREDGSLYVHNLEEVLMKTAYEYSRIKDMAQSHKGVVFSVHNFLCLYPEAPFVEYMIKYNLCNILKNILRMGTSRYYRPRNNMDRITSINAKANDIAGLLRIERYDLHYLQESNANLVGLEFLQYCRAKGIKPQVDQIKKVQAEFSHIDNFTWCLEYTTVHKALRYISTIKKTKGNINIWKDYITMCKQLKYDLKSDFVLFPRNLKNSHDICVDILNEKQRKKEKKTADKNNKNIRGMYKELMKKYAYENDEFMIIAPRKASEIIAEGHALRHCVASYVSRVNEGSTTILFLRKKREPDNPFYTIEIKDGEIKQCYGKKNEAATPDIKKFIDKFKKVKLGVNRRRTERKVG